MGHIETAASQMTVHYNTGREATKQSILISENESVDSDIEFNSNDEKSEDSFKPGKTTFSIIKRPLPLLKMPKEICSFSVKEKQKSLKEAARDRKDHIVTKTVRKLVWSINE